MSSSSASHPLLREIEGARTGHEGRPSDAPVSGRKPPKRIEATGERPPTTVERARMAKLFNLVVIEWGGTDAVATFLGIDRSQVSRMRTGEKVPSLRNLLALFEGNPRAFIAFAVPWCEDLKLSIPVAPLAVTRAELAEALLADFDDDRLGRRMIEVSAKKRGWSEEQVAPALRSQTDDEPTK